MIEVLIDDYLMVGLQYVLCIDIFCDGMLAGLNVELYCDFCC